MYLEVLDSGVLVLYFVSNLGQRDPWGGDSGKQVRRVTPEIDMHTMRS